jgi:hypothetical protein
MNQIDKYFEDILYPRFESYKVNGDIFEKLSKDIRKRLLSIISRWNDLDYRRTLFVTGVEEAYFYNPPVNIEIRCLVVLAIRNSIIEDLASTDQAAKSFGLEKTLIPDLDIRKFTTDAINFFSKFNFENDDCIPLSPEDDVYGSLETSYPLSWNVIKELGKVYFTNKKYANLIFFTDSFKSLTRNPHKLFNVIETVLAKNATVVTSNFFISRDYVSYRQIFVRPGHSKQDMINNLKNRHGLSKLHLKALNSIS